jgi:uncharacterized damage-inducible protein DinB
MTIQNDTFKKVLLYSLKGKSAHINPLSALEGLTKDIAGAKGINTPHTIWQLLKHLNYWQEKFIQVIEQKGNGFPKSSQDGWAKEYEPASDEELNSEVKRFEEGLKRLESLISENESLDNKFGDYSSGYEVIQAASNHNSYHIGEIVFMRKILGAWPPPKSGGIIW